MNGNNNDSTTLDIYEIMTVAEDEELNLDDLDDDEDESSSNNKFRLMSFSYIDSRKYKRQVAIRNVAKTTRGYEILTRSIVAKVMNKTPLHTSRNEKFRFFRVDLKDDDSAKSQIRLSFMVYHRNTIIDDYYANVNVDKVYSFKNLKLRQNDIRFCSLRHGCELYFHFEQSTVASFIGLTTKFNFRFEYCISPISSIMAPPLRSRCIDIVGKIKKVTRPMMITYYDKVKYRKLSYNVSDVTVVDSSLKSITFTAWRDDSTKLWEAWTRFTSGQHDQAPVILVKALKLIVQSGRITIKTLRCGLILIFEPASITIETQIEVRNLNKWYESQGGKYLPCTTMSEVAPEHYQNVRLAMDDYIKNRHDSSISISSTAIKFQVERTTLNLCLNRMGIRCEKVHHIDVVATTRAAWRSESEKGTGKATAEIAKEEGVTIDAVWKRRRVLGIARKITVNGDASKRAAMKFTEAKKLGIDKSLIECAREEGVTYDAAKHANRNYGEKKQTDQNPKENRKIALYLVNKLKTNPSYTVSQAILHHRQKDTKKRQDAVRAMSHRLRKKEEKKKSDE